MCFSWAGESEETLIRGFRLNDFLSSSAGKQPHTSAQLRRGRGLRKLAIWGIYRLVETLLLCLEGSVNMRTLETNKITALCT